MHQQQIQQNTTVYKVYPHVKQYWKSGFITDQDPLLEVLCVNKCMCMRILSLSQFPTDDNDQEKVRKGRVQWGKGGRREEEGREKKIKREEEVKRKKENCGNKGREEREGSGYSGMGERHRWVARLCKYAGLILITLGKVKLCWCNMGIIAALWIFNSTLQLYGCLGHHKCQLWVVKISWKWHP